MKKTMESHSYARIRTGWNEGETDTWGIDEWKTKNKELEKMVAEKTADLEIKNRELEIEGLIGKSKGLFHGNDQKRGPAECNYRSWVKNWKD
jgi:hypothetical protein